MTGTTAVEPRIVALAKAAELHVELARRQGDAASMELMQGFSAAMALLRKFDGSPESVKQLKTQLEGLMPVLQNQDRVSQTLELGMLALAGIHTGSDPSATLDNVTRRSRGVQPELAAKLAELAKIEGAA